jgi:hypothetical protein
VADTCVFCAFTDVVRLIDVVAPGWVVVLVTVGGPELLVDDVELLVLSGVALDDVELLVFPAVALETAPLAAVAALDAALLTDPDPQALNCAVATPRTRATTTSGRRGVSLIIG